jgi:cytidylate kinase
VIVAIDGPAGAGKSTVARLLADQLGMAYLNTGSMYRAIALLALRRGINPGDEEGLTNLARAHAIRLYHTSENDRVMVDDEDVTDDVRQPAVTALVSEIAAHGELRAEIVRQQREVMEAGDWVADGRDIGSVVCPKADVKVFLTASPEERARRRHAELQAGGDDVALGDVLQQITERDHKDTTRRESPLVVAPGAVELDTTGLTIAEVVDRIAAIVRATE